MQSEVDDLIDVLLRGIAKHEAFAGELAELANWADAEDHSILARGMRELTRHHRVKGMEGRAKIAALATCYVDLPLDEHGHD